MVVMSEQTSLLGKSIVLDQPSHLPHLRLSDDKVRGIDLARRKVTTEKGEASYDFLIIDRTPYISSSQLRKIRQAYLQLLAQLKVAIRRKQAPLSALTFEGEDNISWQLALAAQADLERGSVELRRYLRIRAVAREEEVMSFLAGRGIESEGARCPGVKIAAFRSNLPVSKIKGALVDYAGYLMCEPEGHMSKYQEVFVVDDPSWRVRNCSLTIAKQANNLVANIVRAVEGQKLLSLDYRYPSLILRADRRTFFWHRQMVSFRLRGLAASLAERKFWHHFNLGRS